MKLPRRIWPSGAARRLAHREGASLSNAHHHDRAFSGRRINRRANVSSWNKPKPTVQSVFDLTGHSPKGWVENIYAATFWLRNPARPPEARGSSMLSRLPLCSRRILLRARANRPKYVDRSRMLTTA